MGYYISVCVAGRKGPTSHHVYMVPLAPVGTTSDDTGSLRWEACDTESQGLGARGQSFALIFVPGPGLGASRTPRSLSRPHPFLLLMSPVSVR